MDTFQIKSDFMLIALDEAKLAAESDEVPVGAVVVKDGAVIASAHNLVETLGDVSAHAELIAMRKASLLLESKWLRDCVLYVTLEPCAMCMGAAINYRVGAIVFGAFEPNTGCCISKTELAPHIPYVGGLEEQACKNILSEFFKKKR